MRIPLAGLTLVTAALLAGAASAPAQQAQGCAGRVKPDLGFSGMTFNQGTTYITTDLTLFGTEPILTGVSRSGPIEEGDVLVAVDGELITTRAGAVRFADIQPHVPVVLTLRRGGRNLDVRVVPGATCIPESPAVPVPPAPPRVSADGSGLLGIALSCNCSNELDAHGIERWTFRAPPRVEAVGRGGAADRAGLRPGDLIRSIDGVPTTDPEGGLRFGAIRPGQRVRLGVLRDGSYLDVVLVAGKR